MKKTLKLFERKTSPKQQHLVRKGTELSITIQSAPEASNNNSDIDRMLFSSNPISSSSSTAHEPLGLTSIPDSPDLPPNINHPELVTADVVSQHNSHQGLAPAEPSLVTSKQLPLPRESIVDNKTSSAKQIHRTGFTDILDSEQQMATAIENLRKLIEAEEQYSQALTLLNAFNLYFLTNQAFTISRSLPPLFPIANGASVLDDPDRSPAAVHKAWLALLPYHLKAICRAADSSNVRDKHDLESVIDVSAERINSAEAVSFVKNWSHAEQRARMTAALTAMRDGLPDLARRWNVAIRKMKEEEVLGDLRKFVDGIKGRRTGRVFM
ncbi:hypothetical protein MMC18_003251 [Xylographa bjoerkii]|nr:hypothetical protein [Xylographa bjoerkii]